MAQQLCGLEWANVRGLAECAPGRCGHTVTFSTSADYGDDEVLIVGGDNSKLQNSPREVYSEVMLADLDNESCFHGEVPPPSVFPRRSHHAATAIRSGVLFAGGRGARREDMHFEHGGCCAFRRVSAGDVTSGAPKVTWEAIVAPPELCRRGHTMNLLQNMDACVLFGGSHDKFLMSDAWTFDSGAGGVWSRINDRGRAPPGRLFHSAETFNGGRHLVVAGGQALDLKFHCFVLDMAAGNWEQYSPSDLKGFGTDCLYGHTMHQMTTEHQFLLLGGGRSEFYNRGTVMTPGMVCRILDLRKPEYLVEQLDVFGPSGMPEPRLYHASIVTHDGIAVCGGWKPNSETTAADVWRLRDRALQSEDATDGPEAMEVQSFEPVGSASASSMASRVAPSMLETVQPSNMRVEGVLPPRSPRVQIRTKVVVVTPIRNGGVLTGSIVHPEDAVRKVGGHLNPMMGSVRGRLPTVTPGCAIIMEHVIRNLMPDDLSAPRCSKDFDLLSADDLIELAREAASFLLMEPTVTTVNAPVKVFGDLHGYYHTLIKFFHTYGRPDHHRGDIRGFCYLFLGDFIDRGPNSLEVVALLFALKLKYPNRIFMVRGNHEDRDVNRKYGFLKEIRTRFPVLDNAKHEELFEAINSAFDALPLAAVVSNKIFCVHAGIGKNLRSLAQLQRVRRPLVTSLMSKEDPLSGLVYDVMWSDPTTSDDVLGVHANKRGVATCKFGPDRVEQFCAENNLQLVVRAHECVHAGYEFFSGGQLITVFSAARYSGHTNDGSYLEITDDLQVQPKVLQLTAVDAPVRE